MRSSSWLARGSLATTSQERAPRQPFGGAAGTEQRAFDRRRVRDHQDERVRRARSVGGRVGDADARRGQRLYLPSLRRRPSKLEGFMLDRGRLAVPDDAFFEQVLVNAEDEAVRANRLALLARIREATGQVADFSRISG